MPKGQAAALRAWSLLLTTVPAWQLGSAFVDSHLSMLVGLLHSEDVDVRAAAGEAVALLYHNCGLAELPQSPRTPAVAQGAAASPASPQGARASAPPGPSRSASAPSVPGGANGHGPSVEASSDGGSPSDRGQPEPSSAQAAAGRGSLPRPAGLPRLRPVAEAEEGEWAGRAIAAGRERPALAGGHYA